MRATRPVDLVGESGESLDAWIQSAPMTRLRFRGRYGEDVHGGKEGELHDARGRRARGAPIEPEQGLLPEAGSRSSTSSTTTWRSPTPPWSTCASGPTVLKRFVDGDRGRAVLPEARARDGARTGCRRRPSRSRAGARPSELVADDAAHLVWAVNLGVIDFNPWPVRRADLDHPDELRVDLDPTPGRRAGTTCARSRCACGDVLRRPRAARLPEDLRVARASTSTCGSCPSSDFTEVRRAALALAREVERRVPELATSKWWKEERHGVFVDYNQNARDRTVASA